MRWIAFPFLRIVLVLLMGIMMGLYMPDLLGGVLAWWLIMTAFVVMVILVRRWPARTSVACGCLGLLVVMLTGYVRTMQVNGLSSRQHISHLQESIEAFTIQVANQPSLKKNAKVEAYVQAVKIKGRWRSASGGIQLILLYDSNAYAYGDVLMVKGCPQSVHAPSNPGEFDYKQYLAYRNIHYQNLCRQQDVIFIEHQSRHAIIAYAYKARLWGENVLKTYVADKGDYAVTAALVLGVTDELDRDLLGKYASTGVLHVLSVSGLHVGIIFLILGFLFKPIAKRRYGQLVIAVVSILVLWGYAFVTGLSPSVLRAVTMFTVLAISKAINRNSNIYNTLAFSAFVLLLFDPYLIMSVSFQLSYLALLGIIYFQPRIYKLWEPGTYVMDKIWQLSAVSIAAQFVTFPISVLYFHQFPLYFLFANLLVIPASFVVLIGGIILLVIQFIHPLAVFVGWLLGMIVTGMNWFIEFVDALPYNSIRGLSITTSQYWVLMIMLLIMVLMFRRRKFVYVVGLTLSITMFSCLRWGSRFDKIDRTEFVVYSVPHHTAIDVFSDGNVYYRNDSSLAVDTRRQSYSIEPNRINHGVRRGYDMGARMLTKTISGAEIICYRGRYVLRITNDTLKVPLNLPFFDYCIVSNNSVRSPQMLAGIRFKKLIIDSSNSRNSAEKLMKKCRIDNIEVYSVPHLGAFKELL